MVIQRLVVIAILFCITAAPCFSQEAKKVGIFLFDGVQIIDYTGPYEVLGYGFEVFTVSQKSGTIKTNMGMKVIPDYDFTNSPSPDVIVLPGGFGVNEALKQPELLQWIKEKSKTAEITMSVCNGAFFLAMAGMLDGLSYTTTAGYIDTIQTIVPTAKPVRNKRFVDNGKIITTAGLSSGIEGALHIVSRLLGPGWEPIFARWLEYNWDPNSDYTAATLADCNVSRLNSFLFFKLGGEPLKYKGDTKYWESETTVKSDLSIPQLFEKINNTILIKEKWILKSTDPKTSTSTWTFTGKNGGNWIGKAQVAPYTNELNKVTLSIAIDSR